MKILAILLSGASFAVFRILIPYLSKVEIAIFWILYILFALDPLISSKLTQSIFVPLMREFGCPLRIIIRLNIYIFVYLLMLLTIEPLIPLTLKGLIFMGVSNIILGILVMVYNRDYLEKAWNDINNSNKSRFHCGELSNVVDQYYYCLVIVFIIVGVFSIIQATRDSTFERIVFMSIFAIVTIGTITIIYSQDLVTFIFSG